MSIIEKTVALGTIVLCGGRDQSLIRRKNLRSYACQIIRVTADLVQARVVEVDSSSELIQGSSVHVTESHNRSIN